MRFELMYCHLHTVLCVTVLLIVYSSKREHEHLCIADTKGNISRTNSAERRGLYNYIDSSYKNLNPLHTVQKYPETILCPLYHLEPDIPSRPS